MTNTKQEFARDIFDFNSGALIYSAICIEQYNSGIQLKYNLLSYPGLNFHSIDNFCMTK